MLRKLAVTAGLVTILGVAAYFAPQEAQAAGLLPAFFLTV
ncbi:hypothetical protein EDC64_101808 [Aquabacter spiritensis]|uniref:Uncharacterized protein n=1 Tax=Aquabacter spiritensis TaxID=933073 RepID=A0A4R3MA59_9HYPH|nr:hypothetical protein EDC64_101808 [Aquabacter spiritensis]